MQIRPHFPCKTAGLKGRGWPLGVRLLQTVHRSIISGSITVAFQNPSTATRIRMTPHRPSRTDPIQSTGTLKFTLGVDRIDPSLADSYQKLAAGCRQPADRHSASRRVTFDR